MEKINHVGEIWGCYKIIAETDKQALDGHRLYEVECIHCGTKCLKQMNELKTRKTDICVHYYTIGNVKVPWNMGEHYVSDKRILEVLRRMISRCHDSEDKSYKYYGQKGIRVCEEWLNNPELFEKWMNENGYEEGLSIDRIDETKNYCPENCRLTSMSDNARFKSTTNYITATVTLSGKQWSSLFKGKSPNFINRMVVSEGLEYTEEFLRNYFIDKRTL